MEEGEKEKERRGRRELCRREEGREKDWSCPQICLTKNGRTFPKCIGLDYMRNTETNGGWRKQQKMNVI